MAQELRHEIISGGDTVLGQVWWNTDNSTIESDSVELLTYLKSKSYQDVTFTDGPKFLKFLGRMLRNGYIHARKVE